MATIQDLFKSQQKELYGKAENIRIESRGLINPQRGAALLASSPNAIADLIGGQIGGALGGSANRPSDTIFRGKGVFNKPISLGRTQQGLRNAIQPGDDYFVKQSPSPTSILATLNQGSSNLQGVATNLAINAVTKGGLKNLANALKKPKTGKTITLTDGTELPIYTKKDNFSKTIDVNKRWDTYSVQDVDKIEADKLNEFIEKQTGKNQVLVLFQKYGNSTTIPFEGTISGLSEDIAPEWTNFRYVGSPFKVNRYTGVERSLKFNLKLYYQTNGQKLNMVKKINYLKSLAFPYDEISEMKYGGETQTSQYAFSPNLVYLSIGDMYKNVFGFIESLSFSVEENTVWPSNFDDPTDTFMYPSVVDVSISMKIIENHKTNTQTDITRYKYDFDGRGENSIVETKLLKKEAEAKSKAATAVTTVEGPGESTYSMQDGVVDIYKM
jgi:hypothetical protein